MGTKTVMAAAFLLQGVTVIMLFWTHDLWLFYVFALLFGIGFGGESGGFPILNRRYYGHAPMGSVFGAQLLGAGLGMALGGWIGGVTFDITNSYDVALIISIAAQPGGDGQHYLAGAHHQAADSRLGPRGAPLRWPHKRRRSRQQPTRPRSVPGLARTPLPVLPEHFRDLRGFARTIPDLHAPVGGTREIRLHKGVCENLTQTRPQY